MSRKSITKKFLAEADERFDRAVAENVKMHESGMAAISSLHRAVAAHCETACDETLQKRKDSALREAVKEEDEEMHRLDQEAKRRKEQEETRLLPPIRGVALE